MKTYWLTVVTVNGETNKVLVPSSNDKFAVLAAKNRVAGSRMFHGYKSVELRSWNVNTGEQTVLWTD